MGNAARIRICHEARRGGVALAVFIMRKSWVFSDDGRVCRHDKRDGWCVGSFGAGQHRSCRLAHYHRDTRTRDTCPDTVTLAGDGYPCHYQTLVWDILGWVCFQPTGILFLEWDTILGSHTLTYAYFWIEWKCSLVFEQLSFCRVLASDKRQCAHWGCPNVHSESDIDL